MIARWQPARDRAATWWDGRSTREQRLLVGLGLVAAIALLLVAVVRPLEARRARAVADLRVADMLAMRVQGGGITSGAATAGPPGAAISRAAATAGLSVQSLEPQGARISVQLADAPFDAVLRFVAEMEHGSRLHVDEAKVERSGATPGLVTAQFVVGG